MLNKYLLNEWYSGNQVTYYHEEAGKNRNWKYSVQDID